MPSEMTTIKGFVALCRKYGITRTTAGAAPRDVAWYADQPDTRYYFEQYLRSRDILKMLAPAVGATVSAEVVKDLVEVYRLAEGDRSRIVSVSMVAAAAYSLGLGVVLGRGGDIGIRVKRRRMGALRTFYEHKLLRRR